MGRERKRKRDEPLRAPPAKEHPLVSGGVGRACVAPPCEEASSHRPGPNAWCPKRTLATRHGKEALEGHPKTPYVRCNGAGSLLTSTRWLAAPAVFERCGVATSRAGSLPSGRAQEAGPAFPSDASRRPVQLAKGHGGKVDWAPQLGRCGEGCRLNKESCVSLPRPLFLAIPATLLLLQKSERWMFAFLGLKGGGKVGGRNGARCARRRG